MKIRLTSEKPDQVHAEVIAQPVFEEERKPTFVWEIVNNFLKETNKFGKLYETQLLYQGKQKILLVGAGKKEKFGYFKAQNVAGTAAKAVLYKDKDLAYVVPQNFMEGSVLGIELAYHDPSQDYKSEKEKTRLTDVTLVVEKVDRTIQQSLNKAVILAENINLARKLGDMPANEMTPTYFLGIAKKVAKEFKLKLSVVDEKQARKKGMGAFVGVAQGSDEPSYMIALEYRGNSGSKEKWGLVGKGITFDSGGISLKPSYQMHEMKYDMSGAAAILATISTPAKLKVKANVVSVMAVTENLPGGRAQRPGDIIRTYSGKTAEVLDTDAEGRLVLIDALSFVQKDFKATKLVDLATLTGAIIVALGDFVTGAFGNNPKFSQDVVAAGARVGENIWEMPMEEEYGEMIKSDFADMTNIGHGGSMPKAAGSITGAKFIAQAIEDDHPWVHLDIAGTASDMKPKPYRGPGATGVGIKTLVELISSKNKY